MSDTDLRERHELLRKLGWAGNQWIDTWARELLDAYAESVRADERERNCRAMCSDCVNGEPFLSNGYWCHKGSTEQGTVTCRASAIWAHKENI